MAAAQPTPVSNTTMGLVAAVPFAQGGIGFPVQSYAIFGLGTFVLNGTTAVTVADANVTANSFIGISLNTVGGTVGVFPHISTITAGTGFTVVGTASDTSTYTYLRVG